MEYITPILLSILIILVLILLFKKPNLNGLKEELRNLERDLKDDNQRTLSTFSNVLSSSNKDTNAILDRRLSELMELLRTSQYNLQTTVTQNLSQINQILANTGLQNEQKLNQVRETIEKRLTSLQIGRASCRERV